MAKVLFARNKAIATDCWQKTRLQHLFGLFSTIQTGTKTLFSLPLGKLKSKRRSASPLDLPSGNLGGAAIKAAAASCMQQPNCDSIFKDAMAGLLMSKLFATYWEMLF